MGKLGLTKGRPDRFFVSKSVRDVLEELRHFSLDERDKGARFEQLMKDFLRTDTQYERLFD